MQALHDMDVNVRAQLRDAMTTALVGSVAETVGMTATVADFPAPIAAQVAIERESGATVAGEVIGFRGPMTVIYLFTGASGVRRGDRARLVRTTRTLRAGDSLLGRVIDAHGRCIDGHPQPMLMGRIPLDREPPPPVERPRIRQPLATGVHVIDAMLTCGRGQRLGIFSGSGVGKSVLLGMMSRHTDADVIVIALIGERGREVNEFLQRDLGQEGLARSVVVVATSNEPALTRVRAAFTATAVAEYFRDKGRQVLLLMDSVTRFAMAQREIGLAAGEPPTTRGYPPSMFALMPRLVERAGQAPVGSITACYSVLVEGDDETEPVADTVRGLLDGHIWLSRKLAARGQFPAVDVLASVSRLMNDVATEDHREAANIIRRLLAAYAEHEDLLSIGAYRRGSNRDVDVAVDMRAAIEALFRQRVDQALPLDEIVGQLQELAAQCRTKLEATAPVTSAPVASGPAAIQPAPGMG
jgi:flagellum-specific ATP synthase